MDLPRVKAQKIDKSQGYWPTDFYFLDLIIAPKILFTSRQA